MKKKISVLALLCALMVSMCSTVVARADEVTEGMTYDTATYTLYIPKYDMSKTLTDETIARIEQGYNVCIATTSTGYSSGGSAIKWGICVLTYPADYVLGIESSSAYLMTKGLEYVSSDSPDMYYELYSATYSSSTYQYWSADASGQVTSDYGDYTDYAHYGDCYINAGDNSRVVYGTTDIYKLAVNEDTNALASTGEKWLDVVEVVNEYTFEEWCADAELNCSASSNESSDVVPFWFAEDYIYIARKGADSRFYVTMVQDYVDTPIRLYFQSANSSDGSNGTIGMKTDAESDITFTCRDFVYDTDGWLLINKSDCTINCDTTVVDSYCVLDSQRKLLYTSDDIEVSAKSSLVMIEKTTAFDDTYVGDTTPETPTPTPDAGGSSGGGTSEDDTTFMDNLNTMLDMIKVVPTAIASVFSFMPSWCLALVGIGFSLLVAIMIIKAVTG